LSEKETKLPHLRLPVDLHSFLDKLTLGLYRLSKASRAKELKEKDSSLPDPVTIGRALSYLEYLGVVKRTKKGIYELTEEGRKIGIELYQNQTVRADEIWRSILQNHILYEHIQNYIREKGGGVRGSSIGLAEYLRDLAGKDWKTSFLKAGGQRLCDIFGAKGLLIYDKEEDSISFPPEMEIPTPPTQLPVSPPPQPSREVTAPPSSQQRFSIAAHSPALFNVDVQLKIEVSKDTTPELADKIFNFLLKLSEKNVQAISEEKQTRTDQV